MKMIKKWKCKKFGKSFEVNFMVQENENNKSDKRWFLFTFYISWSTLHEYKFYHFHGECENDTN